MSGLIDNIEKRIYINKPEEGSNAQYNYGKINSEDYNKLIGKVKGNTLNTDTDLYTVVQSVEDKTLSYYSGGIMWGSKGSKIEITSCNTRWINLISSRETDDHWGDVKYAFYLYDGSSTLGTKIGKAKTGDDIRNAISNNKSDIKDEFTPDPKHTKDQYNLLGFWDRGSVSVNEAASGYPTAASMNAAFNMDIIDEGAWRIDPYGDDAASSAVDTVGVSDFPILSNPPIGGFADIRFTETEKMIGCPSTLDDNGNTILTGPGIYDWSARIKMASQKPDDYKSYLYIVARGGANERYWESWFAWWVGIWTEYTAVDVDKRDRVYVKLRINKKDLYSLWKNQKGEKITISRTYKTDEAYSQGGHTLAEYSQGNYRDRYGAGQNPNPVYLFKDMSVEITGPTFTIEDAVKPYDEGGASANWVDSTQPGWHCLDASGSDASLRHGLNPRYNVDFMGWKDKFYADEDQANNSQQYFYNNKVKDFRPISFVSSSTHNVDLQSYYEGDTLNNDKLETFASAPNTVDLSFKLVKNNNNKPEYIDIETDEDYGESNNGFEYSFFVTNWDWQEDDPTSFGEIAETFPKNTAELTLLQDVENLFNRANMNGESLQHTYMTEGIKTIKAIVLQTIKCEWTDADGNQPYLDYVQAVHWKLVTIRINLSDQGSFPVPDFEDLGGYDYTTLPYPETYLTNREYKWAQGDPSGENATMKTVIAPSGNPYRSSHPIISGLSEDSNYVKSLNKIINANKFDKNEITAKNRIKKAKDLSPSGRKNEWGDFLGQSDIAQIRFFKSGNINGKTLDMHRFLNLESIVPKMEHPNEEGLEIPEYHGYTDENYWTGNPGHNSFPKSPIGDIFISEYNQFKNKCLVELNCGIPDGNSILDTSGNGNIGILFGDFSTRKNRVGSPTSRDSYVKKAKTKKRNGAF
jgi:hypothetical protein